MSSEISTIAGNFRPFRKCNEIGDRHVLDKTRNQKLRSEKNFKCGKFPEGLQVKLQRSLGSIQARFSVQLDLQSKAQCENLRKIFTLFSENIKKNPRSEPFEP